MDYRDTAKDLLEHRNEFINARTAIDSEIDELKSEKYSIRNSAISSTLVTEGGSSQYEEHLLNLITQLDDAYFRRGLVERKIKQINSGFSILNEYERDLLNSYFVYKVKGSTQVVMDKYHKDREEIFEDRSAALEKFTRGVFGVVQI